MPSNGISASELPTSQDWVIANSPPFGEFAPWVSHPSAILLRLSNATYFYPNLVPIRNCRLGNLRRKAWNCRCSAV
jgi:hypothetical protein